MEDDVINRLIKWCSNRIEQRQMMKIRFSFFLELFKEKINFEIIKITGTNGKGSVASMLSSCLLRDEKNVGLFTSPHLVSLTERFRVNNVDVSIGEVEDSALKLELILKKVVDEKGQSYIPSFFEVLVLIAIDLFNKHKVDFAVFEAGVGGDNDCTSLLPDLVSVITSIGIDHKRQLGETLEEIAIDKTGICSAGSTLVINSKIENNLKKLIKDRAIKNSVNVIESRPFVKEFNSDINETSAILEVNEKTISIKPSLKGYFQRQNIDIVLEVWLILLLKEKVKMFDSILGVESTRWNARFELIKSKPNWILDSAHNPQAFAELILSLNRVTNKENRVLLFGNSEEKDFENILKVIPEIAETIYFIDDFYKSVPQSKLLSTFDSKYVLNKGNSSMVSAIEEIKEKHKDKTIVVAGSIFMVGLVRKYLLKE